MKFFRSVARLVKFVLVAVVASVASVVGILLVLHVLASRDDDKPKGEAPQQAAGPAMQPSASRPEALAMALDHRQAATPPEPNDSAPVAVSTEPSSDGAAALSTPNSSTTEGATAEPNDDRAATLASDDSASRPPRQANAPQAQFDAQAIAAQTTQLDRQRAAVLNAMVLRTRLCMREAAVAATAQGNVSQTAAEDFAVHSCGSPVFHLLKEYGRSEKEAAAFVLALAHMERVR